MVLELECVLKSVMLQALSCGGFPLVGWTGVQNLMSTCINQPMTRAGSVGAAESKAVNHKRV